MMQKKIRALIVDDEPLARSRIRDLLQQHKDIEVVGECCDAFEAAPAIRELHPDLVFLDVQMPEKDGFQLIEEIGVEKMPLVIFVTAFDEYALRAFQVHAFDYLLKPFDETRFSATLERARKQIANGQLPDFHQMMAFIEEWKSRNRYLQRIMVKEHGRLTFLSATDIDWIQAEGNYVRIHSGKSSYLLRETIQRMETQMDPLKFLRIHRSTIVRLDQIREIQQLFHHAYRVILNDGMALRLSRSYRNKLPPIAEKML